MRTENNITINDELLVRYLAGEATPEEALALSDWLQEPANREAFDNLKATWFSTKPGSAPGKPSVKNAWEGMESKLADKPVRTRQIPFYRSFRVAASLLLLITASLVIYIRFRGSNVPPLIASVAVDSVVHVGLPDGSTATLYRNTTLEYPKEFQGNRREIKLTSGEAFFAVSPDKQKPFIIQTPVATIRVVGTSFNVAATNDNLEVSVAEGTVMVYNDKDTTLLQRGMTALLHTGKRQIVVSDSADTNNWGYATGRFVFADTPLRDVISTLEKAYGCVITPSNKDLENCRVNGTFTNDSIENIVHLIAESMTLSVTKNGQVFLLEGKGCP